MAQYVIFMSVTIVITFKHTQMCYSRAGNAKIYIIKHISGRIVCFYIRLIIDINGVLHHNHFSKYEKKWKSDITVFVC